MQYDIVFTAPTELTAGCTVTVSVIHYIYHSARVIRFSVVSCVRYEHNSITLWFPEPGRRVDNTICQNPEFVTSGVFRPRTKSTLSIACSLLEIESEEAKCLASCAATIALLRDEMLIWGEAHDLFFLTTKWQLSK